MSQDNKPQDAPEDETFIYSGPIFPEGVAGTPADSARIIAAGGPDVQKTLALTGKDRFEHMLFYCLTLLTQSGGKICAFYIDDFDDCDEHTLRVIQSLIQRSGYVTSDFRDQPGGKYKGYWAWQKPAGDTQKIKK